ncbi:hypothetical protein KRP22_009441 [Phytophthora ramorum]|nr:hypothetical protein KRP22_8274 [Phytophthora ramorum]
MDYAIVYYLLVRHRNAVQELGATNQTAPIVIVFKAFDDVLNCICQQASWPRSLRWKSRSLGLACGLVHINAKITQSMMPKALVN